MVYTPLTKRAILFAFDAHRGQYDKSGLPYITHPLHVAESMESEDECVVALLHDVLEDTDITIEDLTRIGITDRQIAALKLLCHDDSVPYLEYVQAIRGDQIARKVKLADLHHNSDLTRLSVITTQDIERVEKYKQAIEILLNQ
ncbi:MAG: GTP pyrophosphokinase [Clostridiaceae bacterium]